MSSISDRWTTFYGELENLCDELSRPIPEVIAVTKTRSFDEVQEAIDLGLTDFGENYASQFEIKANKFPEQNWHFIGHLQRNDAEKVTAHAKKIHTVDRKKLVRRLRYFDYCQPSYIQVNISGEDSKSGIAFDKETVKELMDYSNSEGLPITGLMTIGGLDWNNKETLDKFQTFIDFGKSLGLAEFSLGMSADWQLAVRAGSTHLRVGTAIFGPRD